MKKSTLLSLATAGAIILTSAGTYALWDTTTADAKGMLGFDAPVTVSANNLTFNSQADRQLGDKPVASSEVVFTVADDDNRVKELALSATVKKGDTDVTDKVTVTFEKDGTTLAGNKDATLATDGINKYTVKVTPTADEASDDLLGNLDVTVTGTLN